MGVGKLVDADSEPLLANSGSHVVVAAEEARLLAAPGGQPASTRQWEGGLLQCCGACDLVGWGSCLLSRYLPCVAFGSNSQRGLKRSAWLHGLAYLALFGLAFYVGTFALSAASHNVLATCNGRLPHPPHNGPHHPLRTLPIQTEPDFSEVSTKAQQQTKADLDSLFAQAFPEGSFEVIEDENDDDDDGGKHGTHHHHEGDGSDGDHKHKHDEGGKAGKKKGCKKSKLDRKTLPGEPANPLDTLPAAASSFQSVGSFVGRKDPQGWRAEAQLDDGPDDFDNYASPDCQQAIALYCGVWAFSIVTALVAVHYAARRRTQLRERFGIAGSKLGDFCTWCWCGSCALCQETRTLWTNNVHAGVWHGRVQYSGLPAPTVPAQPPPAQFMSNDAARA